MPDPVFTLCTIADRPNLQAPIERLVAEVWPTYFRYARPFPDDGSVDWVGLYRRWPHLQLALLDGARVIASAHTAPLAWQGDPATLPEDGWDWAMRQSAADQDAGHTPHTLCGLAVTIARDRQGEGLSRRMLQHMHAAGRALGMSRLIVPVRPSHKRHQPHTPMADYAAQRNKAGLPADPWIRTHVRLGARIVGPCRRAMRLSGTAAEWSSWLGVPVPDDGPLTHPDLLAPLSVHGGVGLYTEPNLWMVHG